MVSNPAFLGGPEMRVWVSCFWGDSGVIFGLAGLIFWSPRIVICWGAHDLGVWGHQGGFCGVKPSIF